MLSHACDAPGVGTASQHPLVPRKPASTTGSPLEPVPAKAGTGISGMCCTVVRHFSNSLVKQQRAPACRLAYETCVITRILCRGPGQACLPSRFLTPRQSEGDGAPSDATIYSCVPVFPLENTGAPLGAPPGQARAVRAYLRAFSLRHRAVLFVGRSNSRNGPSVSQAPGGQLLLATRRGPGAARVRACEARPRAPHPCSTIRRL